MAQSNYQEPIEQKDLDLAKKIKEVNIDSEKGVSDDIEKKGAVPAPEISKESQSEISVESPADTEVLADKPEERVSEKIETGGRGCICLEEFDCADSLEGPSAGGVD